MSSSGYALSVEGLSVRYGRVSGVEDVSFTIAQGETVALVGPNGAGKTSTLRAIAGLLPRSGVRVRGQIMVGDHSVRGSSPWQVAALGVSMIPAVTKVFPHLTAKEHLQMGGRKLKSAQYDVAYAHALDLFPRLGSRLSAPAAALSGGERQMLALAAATMQRPSLLMIDELSQGLAPSAVAVIVEALQKLTAEGLTLLVVEQSLGTALSLADRCYALESGRVSAHGPAEQFRSSADLAANYLGRQSASAAPEPEPARAAGDEEPCITVAGLSVRFRGLQALSDVTIAVDRRQTVGLIGPNGAGKSTLLNCINGVVRPTAGEIALNGRSIRSLRPDQIARLGVARSFQNAELWKSMEVLDVVQLGTHTARPRRQAALARARVALDFVGMAGVEGRAVADLPYGHAKLVDLARALASEPEILLLDEPASGLTQAERAAMAQILVRVGAELKITTVIVEHDMQMVRECCARVIVLSHGRVIAQGSPDTVLAEEAVAKELLGLTVVPDLAQRSPVPKSGRDIAIDNIFKV
jgi:ABC-type branched-subunit amino acid transport system ATPase component